MNEQLLPNFFVSLYERLWNWRIDTSGTKEDWDLRKWDIHRQTSSDLETAVQWLEWQKSHEYAQGFKSKFDALYAHVRNFYQRLGRGELDDPEERNEEIQTVESSAKQLAEHVKTICHLCLKDGLFNSPEDSSGIADIYAEIDCPTHRLTIGTEHFILEGKMWEFVTTLIAYGKQGRFVPRDQDEGNWKNAVDMLRRRIGREQLRRLVAFVRGGYRLNQDVHIKGLGQVAIRPTYQAQL